MARTGEALMTLADVAAVAQVQRPVVTMWRKRYAGTGNPFPAPSATINGTEHFSADDVAAWFGATGKGNNPQAALDTAARVLLPEDTSALTALLALRALTGAPLGSRSAAEILDLADEVDPDDEFLYSELESNETLLPDCAALVDRMVDASYQAGAAFEAVMQARFRGGPLPLARTALRADALVFIGDLVRTITDRHPAANVLCTDATPGGSDLLLAMATSLADSGCELGLAARGEGPVCAARLALQRAAAHGLTVRSTSDGWAGVTVSVSHLPGPGDDQASDDALLTEVEERALVLGPHDYAVVVAPEALLLGPLADGALDRQRSDILRMNRLRFMARLPRGLRPAMSRQAMALWVFGPPVPLPPNVEPTVCVADLLVGKATAPFDGLLDDVLAALDGPSGYRRHAFHHTTPVLLRQLLASRNGLLAGRPKAPVAGAAAQADELAELLSRYSAHDDGSLAAVVQVKNAAAPDRTEQNALTTSLTIERAISDGWVRMLKGTRLNPDQIPAAPGGQGVALIGPDDIQTGRLARTVRRAPTMQLVATSERVSLTEPGDVIFSTAPRPAAIVDRQGGNLVLYPARALRIRPGAHLSADVLAYEINAQAPGDKSWKHWPMRTLDRVQSTLLARLTAEAERQAEELARRMEDLQIITKLVVDGVAAKALALSSRDEQIDHPQEGQA